MPHHVHRVSELLLRDAVRVLVVGCGGTGSAVAHGLVDLHQAMIARGHPKGLSVTLQDGDTISPTNCVRQPFSQGEVGHNKADILASRINLFWGLRWKSAPRYLTEKDSYELEQSHIVIGCVDSGPARAMISRMLKEPHCHVFYWLDFGNRADVANYILGQPVNSRNPDHPGRLLTAVEQWPEIVKSVGENVPSCSAAEAITRQRPFLNRALANHGLSVLDYLFSEGITHHGGVLRLTMAEGSNRLVSAIAVPPQPAVPVKPAKKKPRRAAAVG